MRGFLELLDGVFGFLQGLVEFNEVFSWGRSKKNKQNALQSNDPQPNTTGGCILRGLGCLFVLAVIVLIVLYVIGTFVAPPKPNPAEPTPTFPSSTTPTSPKDIKIPKLSP